MIGVRHYNVLNVENAIFFLFILLTFVAVGLLESLDVFSDVERKREAMLPLPQCI